MAVWGASRATGADTRGARSLVTTTFSEDSTLMAAGFSESYIRLWNLKGGKLQGMRTDFDSDEIRDGEPGLGERRRPCPRLPADLIPHPQPTT